MQINKEKIFINNKTKKYKHILKEHMISVKSFYLKKMLPGVVWIGLIATIWKNVTIVAIALQVAAFWTDFKYAVVVQSLDREAIIPSNQQLTYITFIVLTNLCFHKQPFRHVNAVSQTFPEMTSATNAVSKSPERPQATTFYIYPTYINREFHKNIHFSKSTWKNNVNYLKNQM